IPPPAVVLLLTRPPARSPLFPYTTLFRSPGGAEGLARRAADGARGRAGNRAAAAPAAGAVTQRAAGARLAAALGRTRLPAELARSEEHTSELQSRENLVCRLLLEKKKHKP